ncbi:PstS family phosphate ABC transporter substrate-binding protein [Bdellovibrio sp. HCB2-146]|uniref:PstS family phosphate ABC transporter substrate-binding protein n=1 Tax=Bdellovibrio sp. HCB2-146 TaxID=3394362 RepID=UPI0039BD7AC1
MLLNLLLTVFASANVAHAQVPVIKIDGSSTVFPITEAMAEEFQTSKRGKVRVTVGISGTGGGFKKFCRGETDVQDASRPIQSAELENCRKAGIKFLELPIAYDATAVVVNPKNTWVKSITVEELKKMWAPEAQGKVMKWSDVNPAWPKENFKLYGAGSDSGTFDYFTEAIVGKAKSSRGDYTASEDDNTLVTGVSNDKNALGYVPLAYYEENKAKLKVVGIVGGDKAPKKNEAVLPSRETVEAGSYFPLSRPIFIYVSEASLKKAEVKEFVEFYLKNSATIVPQVKYVALPAKAYEMAQDHVKKNKLGTVFGGHSEVGIKIEDLLKKEGSL